MHCGRCDNIPFWRWLKLNQKFTTSITCNDYDGEKLSNLKYNQIILLVTVVSICALFSYQMHCSEDKSVWNLPMDESPLEARRYIEVFINKVDRKSPNGSNASS
jgi:hypothetical protein